MILLEEHPWAPFARELIEAAKEAQKRSYAPYSKFMVGAAVMTAGKNIYVGSNMEGAAYVVLHGERSAFDAMNMAGERSPLLIAVVGALEDAPDLIIGLSPCGHCRQDIKEFASLSGIDTQVVILNPKDGLLYIASIDELLPFAFGPAEVAVKLAKYRR